MVVDSVQARIGFDVFMNLFRWATVRFKGRRLKKVVSEAYQELLKGDKADLMKVESCLRKLRQEQASSPEIERLHNIHRGIKISGRTGKVVKKMAGKAAPKKMTASKKIERFSRIADAEKKETNVIKRTQPKYNKQKK